MIETRRHTGRGIEIGQPHRDNAAGLPVACYGVTLREVILLVADEAETALLDTLSADQRVAYYAGKLALRRNSDEPPSGDGKGNDDPLRRNADDRDQRIIRMFAEGTSKRAIAREIGCSDGTVRNVILRHQVDAG